MLTGLMARLLSAHKGSVLAIVVLQLVQTTANLLLPTLNAAIIDDGIIGGDTGEILHLGGWMVGIAAVQVVTAIAAGYLGAVVAMELGGQLRGELFAKVQSFSSQEVGVFGAPSLVNRATNDVAQIQNLAVLIFTMLIAAPAIFIGGIALAVHQDVALSWIVVAVIPILTVIMTVIVRRLIPLYREGQGLLDRISRVLREQIIGANVIRGFVRQDHEIRRFDEANKDLTRNNLRSALLVAGMMPMIMLVVNLSSVCVVWFGGHRIDAGEMRLGALTAFMAYILQILIAIMMAMYVFMTAPRAAACAERIREVLDTVPAIADPAAPPGTGPAPARQRAAPSGRPPRRAAPRSGNAVEFKNVTFAYPGAEAPVLDGVSFTASPRDDDGDHRCDRQRQDDPPEPASPVPGCDRRRDQHRRTRRAGHAAGRPARPHRDGPAAVLPVFGYGRGKPPARLARGRRPGIVAGARGCPGRRLCPRTAPRTRSAREPGRHQLLRRRTPAPVHRPGPAQGCPRLPVRRQFLGPGLRHGCAGSARRSSRCCVRRPC